MFAPVRKQNLLLYLPMTEGSGTTLRDWSPYGSSATLVGNAAWVKDPGGFASEFGTKTWVSTIDGAVYLPALADTRIEVPPDPRFNFNTSDFSILLVMSGEPMSNNSTFAYYIGGVGGGCGGRSGWGLWGQLDGTGCVLPSVANCNQANNFRPNVANACFPDRFTHMWVITRTGNSLKFYRDGGLVGTATMTGDFGDAGTHALVIGDGNGSIGATEPVGKYGPIVIWNVVLTDEEINHMYVTSFLRQ